MQYDNNTYEQNYYIFHSFSVADASIYDEVKLKNVRRRSTTSGFQGSGERGVAVVGKPLLTKARRRRQTG